MRFVSSTAPELHVRADFLLLNSGSSELLFLDVKLPPEKRYGRANLRAQVDGQGIALESLPEDRGEAPDTLRIPLGSRWTQKQRLDLVIEYSFRSPEDPGSHITLTPTDFHLSSQSWFPVLQPPKHLFAPFPKRPDKTQVTIRVPENFMVLSPGAFAGRKQNGSDANFLFLLRASDLSPYVVSGNYIESTAGRQVASAVFWTHQPPTLDPAGVEQITAAWHVLQDTFGPLDKQNRGPHIVESSGLRAHVGEEEGPVAAPFPGGALVNPAALALGVGNQEFLSLVMHALAHNWFGGELYPSDDAALGISEGLPEYAGIVVDEARGGEPARRRQIARYLQRFLDDSQLAPEKPLGVTLLADPREQRRIALAKAPLFYIALEDAYGETPIRAGLKNLVSLLRGKEVGYDDLRSALEQSTGKNLAEPFRVWLYGKGIPKEFLERHAPQTNERNPEQGN